MGHATKSDGISEMFQTAVDPNLPPLRMVPIPGNDVHETVKSAKLKSMHHDEISAILWRHSSTAFHCELQRSNMNSEREQFIDTKQKLSINWANKENVSQREAPQVTPSPELNSQNSGRTSASRVGDCRWWDVDIVEGVGGGPTSQLQTLLARGAQD